MARDGWVMAKKPRRDRRTAELLVKPKKNLLASVGLSAVDYKDTASLRVFISERGARSAPGA